MFLTAEDETTPDGAIQCKQITEATALHYATSALRTLSKLTEVLG